jgi:hypothetical protein
MKWAVKERLYFPQYTWRIFDSKGLVDFFRLQSQIYCLTCATGGWDVIVQPVLKKNPRNTEECAGDF